MGSIVMSKRIGIQIDPQDNVVTVMEEAASGDEIHYVTAEGPRKVTTREAIPMGHKVALRDLAVGEPIVKYRQTIGTASNVIEQGRHVHTHNVQSAVQGARRES